MCSMWGSGLEGSAVGLGVCVGLGTQALKNSLTQTLKYGSTDAFNHSNVIPITVVRVKVNPTNGYYRDLLNLRGVR